MTIEIAQQQKLKHVKYLAQQHRFNEAHSIAQEITQVNPDFADAWYTMAFIAFHCGLADDAITAIQTAKKIDPNNPNYAFQEILFHDALNRPDLSLPLAQQLLAQQPANVQMLKKIADILELNEDFIGALKIYEQFSAEEPNNTQWLLKKATTFQSLGKIETASELCQRGIQLEPENVDLHFFQSHLKKNSKANNHIQQLKALSKHQHLSNPEQSKLYFALAKELEDCEQYDESFDARKTAAQLYRSSFQYDVQSDIEFMKQVQIEYDADCLSQQSKNNTSNQPIFIVGLPRSGTTLLDRVITSHTDVKAAGELRQLNRGVIQEIQKLNLNPQMSRTSMVTASKEINFDRLGKNYLLATNIRGQGSPRFTDKFPQNSYYVGMILKALPNAKIIIMQRHPVSVCYAVYKQLFSDGSYPFSYNLEELAKYYNQHNQLLLHWQKVGGNAVKTVFYEDLVSNLEFQAKDILDFLELSWQPHCLDFHKNKQPTATASASQVREKLYSSSVDLWRNYEQQLQPLIKLLNTAENTQNKS